jgi:hypothetical protein
MEYQFFTPSGEDGKDIEALNAIAREGWRVAHVVPPPSVRTGGAMVAIATVRFLLERPTAG